MSNSQEFQDSMRERPRLKLSLKNAFGMTLTNSLGFDMVGAMDFVHGTADSRNSSKLSLVYPVGKHIGIRNVVGNTMKFIHSPDDVHEITQIALSADRWLLAVGVKLKDDKSCHFCVVDLRSPNSNLQHLSGSDKFINCFPNSQQSSFRNSKFISDFSFTPDTRLLACLIKPDHRISIYSYLSHTKEIAFVELHKTLELHQINFCPVDPTVLVVSGKAILQLYTFSQSEGTLTQSATKLEGSELFSDGTLFSSHAWTEDGYLIAGAGGPSREILVIRGAQVVQSFDSAPSPIAVIRSFPGGVIIGCECGTLLFYSHQYGKEEFTLLNKWLCKQLKEGKILSIGFIEQSPSELYMAVVGANKTIVYLNLYESIYTEEAILGLGDQQQRHKSKSDEHINYEIITQGFHSGSISKIDVCLQRPLIATASKDDCNVRLWNYVTGTCELARVFFFNKRNQEMEVGEKGERQKALHTIAIHPCGYYMAVCCINKILMVHILNESFKKFHQTEIKNCQQIAFSNGGQYFVAADQKFIFVWQAMTMELLGRLKAPSQNISELKFNETDTILTAISHDGFMSRWSMVLEQVEIKPKKITIVDGKKIGPDGKPIPDFKEYEFKRLGDGAIEKTCRFNSCYFIDHLHPVLHEAQPASSDSQLLLIGGSEGGKRGSFRVFNSQEQQELTVQFDLTEGINQMCYAKTQQLKLANFISGTQEGSLLVHPTFPEFQSTYIFEQLYAHVGPVTALKVSPDGQHVFSGGEDGIVFVYALSEFLDAKTAVKGSFAAVQAERADPLSEEAKLTVKMIDDNEIFHDEKLMDESLANIVLVMKEMMEYWKKRKENLAAEIEEQKAKTESQLNSLRNKFDQDKIALENTKKGQIDDLKKRLEDLQQQEKEQKEDNAACMKKDELNHLQCLEDLQTLYEKRLAFENQKYQKQQNVKAEIRTASEDTIRQLQMRNDEAVDGLLATFKNNLHQVQSEYEDTKKTADSLKQTYEEKLTQQEDEHEAEIYGQKNTYGLDQEALEDKIGVLRNKTQTEERQTKRINEERKMYAAKKEQAKNKQEMLSVQLNEKKKEVTILEGEKEDIQNKLNSREKELHKYKDKIKDLQKTKQVLTHRTQEMQASLEPKQQQIANLKEQLLALEKVYEQQRRSLNSLAEEVQKRETRIQQLTNQLQKEKARTKNEEKVINMFTTEINKLIQSKDEKIYKDGLLRIFDKFVKPYQEEILAKKRKDPETIEEMDRQLRFLEKCKVQMKLNAKKSEIAYRHVQKEDMLDNVELMHELKEERKRKRNYEIELRKVEQDVQKQALRIKKIEADEENAIKHQSSSKDDMDLSRLSNNQSRLHPSGQQSKTLRGSQSVGNLNAVGGGLGTFRRMPGRLMKGMSIQKPQGSIEDRQQIKDLMNALEDNYTLELLHQLEIRSLKDKIIQMHRSSNPAAQMQDNPYGNSSLATLPPIHHPFPGPIAAEHSPLKGFEGDTAPASGLAEIVGGDTSQQQINQAVSEEYGTREIREVRIERQIAEDGQMIKQVTSGEVRSAQSSRLRSKSSLKRSGTGTNNNQQNRQLDGEQKKSTGFLPRVDSNTKLI